MTLFIERFKKQKFTKYFDRQGQTRSQQQKTAQQDQTIQSKKIFLLCQWKVKARRGRLKEFSRQRGEK